MLHVSGTQDRNQQWLGVADIMKAEAHEQANADLDRAAGRVNGIAAITAERVIREGPVADEILGLIEDEVHVAAGLGLLEDIEHIPAGIEAGVSRSTTGSFDWVRKGTPWWLAGRNPEVQLIDPPAGSWRGSGRTR